MIIVNPLFNEEVTPVTSSIVLNEEEITKNVYPWSLFAYRLLSNKIDNRWTITTQQFSFGNRILNALSLPSKRISDMITRINQNRFIVTHFPRAKSIYYSVPVTWGITEKIVAVHGKINNSWTLVTQIEDKELSDTNNIVPKAIKFERYDIPHLQDIYTDNILDEPIEYNYETFSEMTNNPLENTYYRYLLIVPGTLTITIDSNIKRKDPNSISYLLVNGDTKYAYNITDSIKLYGKGVYSTNIEFVRFNYLKLVNVKIEDPETFSLHIRGPLNSFENEMYDINSLPFADYDGPFFKAFVKAHHDSIDKIPIEGGQIHNQLHSIITLKSYAAIKEEYVANGINDIESNIQIVLNNPYVDQNDDYKVYASITVDKHRHFIYGITNYTKLVMFSLDIPEPPKKIIEKINKKRNTSFILETDFQYPMLNETVTITPTILEHNNKFSSITMKMYNIDPNDQNNIITTDFGQTKFDTPIYDFDKEKPQFSFIIDQPGFYLFEASILYVNGDINKNYMPIYIPELSPIASFELPLDEFESISETPYVAQDGTLYMLSDSYDRLYKITPMLLRYFYDNSTNSLLLTDKYDSVEIETL